MQSNTSHLKAKQSPTQKNILPRDSIILRNVTAADFDRIASLCLEVYPFSKPWRHEQLKSHLEIFPEGQLVAERLSDRRIIGYSASFILSWRKVKPFASWRSITDAGYFTGHDPVDGKTLYGAEIIVSPHARRQGVGSLLYRGRRQLVSDLGLLRIRAGARLRGYGKHARALDPQTYLEKVSSGELHDPTLSFQLRKGFRALHLIPRYLEHDPESLGFAALIEWTPGVKTERQLIACA